ncbi:hypothetical protein PoB_005907100 [Plakobranchus ocellatus]|uniref:Uncharacterized protein n=1 Tax=Plakobranchus ocellatus TaxID=259542 RepID=A0AAV4CLI4_9GAST|nr:hypothetical protein PoB_005907100 [Plakobranchus ocellatus]
MSIGLHHNTSALRITIHRLHQNVCKLKKTTNRHWADLVKFLSSPFSITEPTQSLGANQPASLAGGACENPSLPIAKSYPKPPSLKIKTDCPKFHHQRQCNINLNASCKELHSSLTQQRKTVAEMKKKKYQVRVVTQKCKRFNVNCMELEKQVFEHKKL